MLIRRKPHTRTIRLRISIIIPIIRIIPVFLVFIVILKTPIFGNEFLHHSSQT